MRNIPLAAGLAALMTALFARPAAAQTAAAILAWASVPAPALQSPPVAPAPLPPPAAAPPAPVQELPRQTAAEDPRLRQWQEAAFAQEALSMSGNRISKGALQIKPGRLYAIVGRPDLVDTVRTRKTWKGIAVGTGIGVAALGTAMGVLDSTATAVDNGIGRAASLCGIRENSAGDPACAEKHSSPFPWMMAAAGGLLAVTGAVVPADPLSREQKAQLVDDYNRRLRAGMGLSGALESARQTASVQAGVQPDGRAGMLSAGCAF